MHAAAYAVLLTGALAGGFVSGLSGFGTALMALGIWLYVAAFSPSTTFASLLPGLVLHGIGIGFATSQLTNVVLSDIPPQKAGSVPRARVIRNCSGVRRWRH